MGKGEPFWTVGGNADWCNHCRKQCGDASKNLNKDLPFSPIIPPLGIYPNEPQKTAWKNISTPMFIATLFNYGTLHNGILISNKKEDNFALWDSMDQPGEHYAKWNKPVRER